MKTFKQFLENEEQIISSDELVEIVKILHLNDKDFEQGNLEDRIRKYDFYKLVDVDANHINAEVYYFDDETGRDYEEEYKRKLSYPPIVLDDGKDVIDGKDIIDGTHRAKALKNLGHKTIKAWVPT